MEAQKDINGGGFDHYDWAKEVAAFEETKAGVKGLADSGILKIPNFFIHNPPPDAAAAEEYSGMQIEFPTVNLLGVGTNAAKRREAVGAIREAAGTWGFFRMTGHGVPTAAVDGVLEATRRFHEQPVEEKKRFYSSYGQELQRFFTINGSLEKDQVANWRDALAFNFLDGLIDSHSLPLACRKEVSEYMKHMIRLRDVLCELLSEALGLNKDYLSESECMRSEHLACIYYPPCPEPDRTFGHPKHTDTTFLTIVAQDEIGGYQVLHQDRWVDVAPVPGVLLAHVGDLLQLITNDRFKSVEHRVLARSVGTRVSTACFFFPSSGHMSKLYGPIKELLSESNPPLYKEVSNMEYIDAYQKNIRIPLESQLLVSPKWD